MPKSHGWQVMELEFAPKLGGGGSLLFSPSCGFRENHKGHKFQILALGVTRWLSRSSDSLILTQVMVSQSWDQALHWAPR